MLIAKTLHGTAFIDGNGIASSIAVLLAWSGLSFGILTVATRRPEIASIQSQHAATA